MNELLQILNLSKAEALNLLPYMVIGVLAAEAARYSSAAALLERICRRTPSLSVLLAALLGIASPLCTYGTVPVVLQLLRAGMPLSPLITFLATSSLMNPQLMIMTWGGLGHKIAVGRLVAVLTFGLVLGTFLHFIPEGLTVQPALLELDRKTSRRPRVFGWKEYFRRCAQTLRFVGFYVILGILIGSTIEVVVPGRWVYAVVGGDKWWHILLAALLGVPLYACGGGTIPLVAALLESGMSSSAAIAFLVAGPATRVAPLMALAALLRPTIVVGYVAFLLVFSTISGLIYGIFW